MEKMVSRGKQYLETIFTSEEMDYCEKKAHKCEHYAARYAAKEAVLEALGKGWRGGLSFTDIEILHAEQGKPRVVLHGKVKAIFKDHHIRQASVSLSHVHQMAIAFAILED